MARLGETIAGWKTNLDKGVVTRAPLLRSRIFESGQRCLCMAGSQIGIEAEIAFLLERDLPARDEEYSRGEIEENSTALVVIEVLQSRFSATAAASSLNRMADCMSHSALIVSGGHAR